MTIDIPSESKLKQLEKRAARKAANKVMKASTREMRQRLLVQLGQRIHAMEETAAKAEKDPSPYVNAALDGDQNAMLKLMGINLPGTTTGGRSLPRLSWLNGKMYAQSQGGRRGVSDHKSENLEAFTENASRDFTKQVDLVFNPPVDINDIAPEVTA